MNPLRVVGVKELKNNLSYHLREVKAGATILVSDRNIVVAELRQPSPERGSGATHPVEAEWLASGALDLERPPLQKARLGRSPLRLPEGASRRLLDEDRDDERRLH